MDAAGHSTGGHGVVDHWIDELDSELRAAGDPARAVNEKAYLKSASDFYGVSVPAMRAMAKRFARLHRDIAHDDLIALIEGLWTAERAARPVHERRLLAVLLAEQHLSVLDAVDISTFEQMIRESQTWALVDVIAA
ncbi:MAG: DNA alkylation repair protein, partial [Acidimicrobiia bacterium]